MMSLETYQAYVAQGYNRIPLTLTVLADLDTPLSLYLKLANKPFSYLLESVVGGERFGRYSFIGLPCRDYLKVEGDTTSVYLNHELTQTHKGDPMGFIEAYQASFKTPDIPNLPRFTGGLIGYFGYETVHYFEPKLPKNDKKDVIGTPDIMLMLSEELAVIDNLSGKIHLIVYANPEDPNAYQKARSRLEELRIQTRQSYALPLSFGSQQTQPVSEYGEDNYKRDVADIKQRILAGDCMQVVPSQRMSMPFSDNPISLYRALRTLNPSPYMYYYHMDDFYIVGASPEILVRKEADTMTVRPIAGTRVRGQTPEEDAALAADLLSDPKEVSEHVMLIDLGRNDVGRVAKTGAVKVTEKMCIEKYSHVMHIVSSVEGELPPQTKMMDVLKAAFPAGTLSGAPKVKAMEIIHELEPSKRGIFGGAVGYLSFSGDMDVAIAIRTAIIKNQTLYVQSGAGIVADSDPQSEWDETQNKARAVVKAAHMVQAGLDA
ncbi:MAG: anthranilate synthase component I [Neisseriaceae bacterium]|nr:anthranilate synthase component I [Neisseriaceae bacterium]